MDLLTEATALANAYSCNQASDLEIEQDIDGNGELVYLDINEYGDGSYLFQYDDGSLHLIVEIGGGIAFTETYNFNTMAAVIANWRTFLLENPLDE